MKPNTKMPASNQLIISASLTILCELVMLVILFGVFYSLAYTKSVPKIPTSTANAISIWAMVALNLGLAIAAAWQFARNRNWTSLGIIVGQAAFFLGLNSCNGGFT